MSFMKSKRMGLCVEEEVNKNANKGGGEEK
jgi:hypothetical protein